MPGAFEMARHIYIIFNFNEFSLLVSSLFSLNNKLSELYLALWIVLS